MDSNIKVQDDLSARINRAKINFKKSSKERLRSLAYINTRLEALEELWREFTLTHTKIVQSSDATLLQVSSYCTNKVFEITEELYMDYKFELKEAQEKLKESKSSSPSCSNTNNNGKESSDCAFKLPKISIPNFSGKYSEWVTFRDLFISLVHNNKSLDDVQRLHYLKGLLAGEAEQLLRHIPITQDNYKTCWAQLERRYNNKKYLSTCILKRFMSQKAIVVESANALKELLDTTNECLYALKNLGIDISSWDVLVIYIVSQKLDNESRKQWELNISEFSEELPTLKQFQDFLETRFRALEFIDPKLSKPNLVHKSNVVHNPRVHHASTITCPYCSESHRLANCKQFCKEVIDSRRDFVQTQGLCFNCLNIGHSVFSCRQNSRCRICKRKHHSLLHPKSVTNSTDISSVGNQSVEKEIVTHATTSSSSPNEFTSVTTCFSTTRSQVLLATALVNAESKAGNGITLRCLIDSGSQASFITESAVQLLNLKKIPHKSIISGLGSDQGQSLASKSMVNVKLQSLHDPNFTVKVQAFVLNKLTTILPEKQIVFELWSEFSSINLADPSFHAPNKIDILLGADIYGQILLDGVIKGPPGAPIAQCTSLGWILSGSIHNGTTNPPQTSLISMHVAHISEDEQLKKFWELEADTPVVDPKMLWTDEEKKCEEIFTTTTERDESGRYIVNLPFRNDNPSCKYGNSIKIATKRFFQQEKRLLQNTEIKQEYSKVISEYMELEHMEEVSVDQRNNCEAIYLPHHAVIRKDKKTTRLRVVFDASCMGSNGVSLNQDLLVGPSLQPDLRHIIMRWRYYPICLVSDIIKMYRQVKVAEKHTDFQRLIWREDPNAELQHLKLLRVTFGTASAPYLAVRCLQQLAYDDGKNYPQAAERVLKEFYMDDLLTGCESVEEGKLIYEQMSELLQRGGFKLQKWSSNSEELLKVISKEDIAIGGNVELNIDEVTKILGLTWNRKDDQFEYAVQLPPLRTPVTKRSVISDIGRLFDPLGWLAPVIIKAKIFIQKLWLSGIDWDDVLPAPLIDDWLIYREDLQRLRNFRMPRWIHTRKDDQLHELHGFCDASNDAYAAVVYLRTVDSQGAVEVSLIASKTKVAPIKQISIPRLELCGAVLVTRLLLEVAAVMKLSKGNMHAWTDSSVVLAWLNSRPNRWKTFVANRVTEIITSLEPHQWAHVSSTQNPADCASRGVVNIENQDQWKCGPLFLKEKIINYKRILQDTLLEEKKNKVCMLSTYTDTAAQLDGENIIKRYSSLSKLLRVIAFCKRFIRSCRKELISTKWITSTELQSSLDICIKITQDTYLAEDLKNLKEKNTVSKKSSLTSLHPWVDKNGVIRVGGRLQHAEVSEQLKHPIVIPQKSHFTELLLRDAHEKTLHGGPQLMLNYLRMKYWIVGAKGLIKQTVRKCVRCVRFLAKSQNPLMGQLPSARAMISRAFFHSGVDYAGPINLRTSKGRGHRSYKGYICLFVCMSTRAIHLEAVSDLTANGFLAAFRRFTARRGHCSELWSDNGTNFVGASRELRSLYAQERDSITVEIANELANNGTDWHFIPPHSPHFGGLWESGVKSTKHHLKRIIGNTTLTFEEMTTVLSQIEACLNSRPISQISQNVEDPMPLTPGHFLILEPVLLPPDVNYEKSNISTLKRWQFTQRLVQDFWRRWSREYLTQFHHRYKWTHKIPEPQLGDIVLVMENDLPPTRWLYGIVVEKHPGSDGITRVVSLRCKNNIIKRVVSKLCFLPISKE